MRVENWILGELNFKKKGKFPEEERAKIVAAVKKLGFKSLDDYSRNFERNLKDRLTGYTDDKEVCSVFKNVRSNIKNTGPFKYCVDLYNPELRIAIEVEKTKETTLLLDVAKFIAGNKRSLKNRPIIEYGVLMFPERYRSKNGNQSVKCAFKKRILNELAFINQILFVKDILLIQYDTDQLK
jgi:hypothetical protein